jgi:prepilin-type N-terminal cleavage/methylation domain-containing protein
VNLARPIFRFRTRSAASTGFSLVEVMVVLTIIGILVAMTVPSYQRAVEQSRADVAAANLRALWSAQRLYWIEHHAYTSNLTALQSLGLLDPAIVLSTTGYVYAVTSAGTNSFRAVAVRTGSSAWTGEFAIDQDGLLSGAIESAGEPKIVAGFQ